MTKFSAATTALDSDFIEPRSFVSNVPSPDLDAHGATSGFRRADPALPPQAIASAARMAGRLNAAQITDEEMRRLLDERAALLDKKFAGEISKKEENRLQYVRWSLDRIEDARYGYCLDALEEAVQMQESMADKIDRFRNDLQRYLREKHNKGDAKR